MAKLIVAEDFQFNLDNPYTFNLSSFPDYDVVKHQDHLWKLSDSSTESEVYVRGDHFEYDANDQLVSGDITSFSFNQGGTAQVRIRGVDNLSAASVHSAAETTDREDDYAVLKSALKGSDVLQGGSLSDALHGYHGSDLITGNSGQDYLYGGSGDDVLKGGLGTDYFLGGNGQDRMHAGNDVDQDYFSFANGDSADNAKNADHIYGFVSGQDIIDLNQTGGNKSEVRIEHDPTPGHEKSIITLDADPGHDKMVIVVVGNDDVHKSDLSFMVG